MRSILFCIRYYYNTSLELYKVLLEKLRQVKLLVLLYDRFKPFLIPMSLVGLDVLSLGCKFLDEVELFCYLDEVELFCNFFFRFFSTR